MKKIQLYFTICLAAALVFSCDEQEFLEENPRDILTSENLYTTPEGFQNGINALYYFVRQERDGMDGRVPGMLYWSSMDNSYNTVSNANDLPYLEWGEYNNATVDFYSIVWSWLYRTVNSANTIVGRAENESIDWEDENQKNETIAPARCVRAWAYRHLINLWGEVPLVETESTGSTIRTDWERASLADLMQFMEQDWLFAEQWLPEVQTVPGRLSKAAAQHYLAELYLMMGEPGMAEQKALAAINNPNFSLITERYGVKASGPGVPFMDQFYEGNVFHNQGNTEALWTFPDEFNVVGESENNIRRTWLLAYWRLPGVEITPELGRGIGWLGPTKFALDLYSPGDDRGSEYAIHRYLITTDGDTIFTTTDPDKFLGVGPAGLEPNRPNNWPSTRKWDDGNAQILNSSIGYRDQIYLRLAETYLLLAEAQHLLGKNGEAAETLNTLRRRSNAPDISAADVTIDFILDERSRELLAEEHRRYTLLRLDKWIERTKAHNHMSGPFITERDKLYPIPQPVIDANLDFELPQNNGY